MYNIKIKGINNMSYIIQALDSLDYNVTSKNSTYYNENGERVPRVTEILSKMIHNDGLMYWANSLGFKGLRYKEVLNNAANMGTIAHNAIEKYLKEKIETNSNIPFLGFLSWYNIIIEAGLAIKPIYIEHRVACKWFGGTLDALMEIGGKIYLMDFKTSNHVTYTYFLQLAAYRYMIRLLYNIEVDGVIVLQLDKEEPGFNEYILTFSNPEHLDFMNKCEEAFLSLVYAFYNVSRVEKDFKNIF